MAKEETFDPEVKEGVEPQEQMKPPYADDEFEIEHGDEYKYWELDEDDEFACREVKPNFTILWILGSVAIGAVIAIASLITVVATIKKTAK